ncbi:hypothetical protein DWX43_11450 [Clostridium sp. AF19-22AC]|jgi:predicted PurR-regulated permease PerM|nr:hypothetical protein DWX43_11450 [Clostridium sp. AF19-22AC]
MLIIQHKLFFAAFLIYFMILNGEMVCNKTRKMLQAKKQQREILQQNPDIVKSGKSKAEKKKIR